MEKRKYSNHLTVSKEDKLLTRFHQTLYRGRTTYLIIKKTPYSKFRQVRVGWKSFWS